jgi:soluble lytic murein transglycosylase-like protein
MIHHVGNNRAGAGRKQTSHAGSLAAVTLALLFATGSVLPSRTAAVSLAQPLSRCRGSKEAHVSIAWPTTAQEREYVRLRWPHQIPQRIRRWAYLVSPLAHAAGVDPYLVAAVMRVESDGDPLIWNLDSDARGLLQVLHASFQPHINLEAGISMLGALQRQFGSRDLVLAAYNAGPGSVEQYGGIPPFVETRDYVVLVGYYRDLFVGAHLSATRTARFRAAWSDLIAYYRRICGRT